MKFDILNRWSGSVIFSAEIEARAITAMAMEIIRITDQHGACADAALRAKFSAEEVRRFGSDACARADEMAANGPFSIVTVGAANAA